MASASLTNSFVRISLLIVFIAAVSNCILALDCLPASANAPDDVVAPKKFDPQEPYELTESQIYKVLSSNYWKSCPKDGTAFSVIAQKSYGKEATYELTFGADFLECSIKGAKEKRLHHWSCKKTRSNGGWVLLKNGGALSLFLFKDGTISLSGRRYFPWNKKKSFDQCKNHVVPGDTFTKLTAGAWAQPNDFNGGPCLVVMHRDGVFSEIRNDGNVEHKQYWSLNSIFEPRFVVHDLDDNGDNDWVVSWKGADLLLSDHTFVRQTAKTSRQSAGLLYGTTGILNFKLTYQRPLRDKKINRLHFEFTSSTKGGALNSQDGFDKIHLKLATIDKKSLKTLRVITKVVDLHGMPAQGEVKTVDIDVVFDKTMRTEISLFVSPKRSYKLLTGAYLVYDSEFRHWYDH